ncbi:group 1 truncated hemoglobin [Prosthecobacter sp. SYSU 5D2]|uniref:group I truncated hemoglobin n=1 Tax=Prosthecobacter sp. SYSU 5D2 TaxID=3134134 RepID=UPI0031FE4F93
MDTQESLYERLGGSAGVETLVEAFYIRVLADPELAPFFRDSSIERLQKMQTEFFNRALGGPIAYSGRPLAHVHHGKGITRRHFALFVGHLLETLKDYGCEDRETDEVIEHINTFANEITGTSY